MRSAVLKARPSCAHSVAHHPLERGRRGRVVRREHDEPRHPSPQLVHPSGRDENPVLRADARDLLMVEQPDVVRQVADQEEGVAVGGAQRRAHGSPDAGTVRAATGSGIVGLTFLQAAWLAARGETGRAVLVATAGLVLPRAARRMSPT